MTKRDQKKIVREMLATTKRSMFKDIDSGKVPDTWAGHELARWCADGVQDHFCDAHEYINDRSVYNIW
mgnify:CR=1 FL=1